MKIEQFYQFSYDTVYENDLVTIFSQDTTSVRILHVSKCSEQLDNINRGNR